MKRSLSFLLVAAALGLTPAAPARAISFIDSPTAYCRKVKGNNCVINWGYMSVDAGTNYMTDLWVLLGDALVYHASGFFQQSMYVDNRFFGDGVPVKCGDPGATPPPPVTSPPTYGASYSYTVRARDTAGLTSANYGTVICPPR